MEGKIYSDGILVSNEGKCIVVPCVPCNTPFMWKEAPEGCCECGMLEWMCFDTAEEADAAFRKQYPEAFDANGEYIKNVKNKAMKKLKLVQIKEFNKETVTQEVAAQICSIVAWNHLKEKEYAGTFAIEQAEPYGKRKDGSGSTYPWRESESEDYIRTEHGVKIFVPATYHRVRIFEDGNLICKYVSNDYDDYETLRRNKKTGSVRVEDETYVNPNNQIRLMQCYIDLGFYTVSEVEE